VTDTSRRDVIVARLRALGPRERAFAIVLAVLIVLTILAVLLSGGGGEPLGVPTGAPTVRAPTPTPTATTPPLITGGFEGKDPFQPLIEAQPSSQPTPTGTSPAPTGSVAGPTGGNQTGSSPTVTLLDIFSQGGKLHATVDVNGTQYTVMEGQTFARNFRVISLSKSCGTFVFGDERFTLCIGQEVHK
jgi:hypothetical protein